jgi:hypothetical protein
MSETQKSPEQITPAHFLPDAMRLLPPAAAAEILHTTEGTLAVWRCEKRYPLRFVKIGGKVFYRMTDIEKFIESRMRSGLSEQHQPRTVSKQVRTRPKV